ncbi:MAG: diguanylate cyclase [Deltaproteobacteria bacterium]|nr:diguanylate cyclase [Deltaproteobacteria bacterium]MBW1930525.1 diguanylate cyclase [Deltaproteobacteria bacterium]MBW2025929.1 diguanylate cyclase [Deltaproteobacteria bacterium]MBW2125711.1 diguanylate cyclase [Deltaproteobacteria bacterium]
MESNYINPEDINYGDEVLLVVDDEEHVRVTLTEMLNHLGFQAFSAGTGNEALDFMETQDVTFLITDMKMPGMDGLELIEKVHVKYPEVCVIAMTGYAKGYRYIDVINAGATDFINKPFGIEELEAKVKRAIIERNIKKELNRLSITDSLTGLYNQRHFYSRLREEVKRAARQKHPLSVILIDLDNFKWYNDTYGHLAGDELLQKVGTIIRGLIREDVDTGYRYGGDEFAVILIDADIKAARHIAGRIQKAIETDCGVKASFGCASFSEGMSAEELLSQADKVLYSKKGIQLKEN